MQSALDGMPQGLRRTAHVTGSGELLWPPESVAHAASWMAAQDLGIIGGEVYGRRGPARGNYTRGWFTDPGWLEREPWSAFVERALAQVLEAVAVDSTPEPHDLSDDEDDPSELSYFLAHAAEIDYPNYLRDRSVQTIDM